MESIDKIWNKNSKKRHNTEYWKNKGNTWGVVKIKNNWGKIIITRGILRIDIDDLVSFDLPIVGAYVKKERSR